MQLFKKFPAFHGTRRFITALTSVRHLSLSWASPIQSIYPHPTSRRSIQILSTHLRLGLPNGLLSSGFPIKTLYTPSPHSYAPHAQPISFFSVDKVLDVLNRADRLSRNVDKNCQHMMRNAPKECRTSHSITPPAVKPTW